MGDGVAVDDVDGGEGGCPVLAIGRDVDREAEGFLLLWVADVQGEGVGGVHGDGGTGGAGVGAAVGEGDGAVGHRGVEHVHLHRDGGGTGDAVVPAVPTVAVGAVGEGVAAGGEDEAEGDDADGVEGHDELLKVKNCVRDFALKQ